MEHPHRVTSRACRSMLCDDMFGADKTGSVTLAAAVSSRTLNAHVSNVRVSWNQTILAKVHRSTDWLPSLPLTHTALRCVCLMQHPAWQPLSQSHYASKAAVSLEPLHLCVGRGGEGGEADLHGVHGRSMCSVAMNKQLAWTDPPALAGACVLSAVFPRIECETNENENEHLIR